MPQYQQLKRGQVRVRILPPDAMRAYLICMQQFGGRVQVLPGDVYVLDETQLAVLEQNGVQYETIDRR